MKEAERKQEAERERKNRERERRGSRKTGGGTTTKNIEDLTEKTVYRMSENGGPVYNFHTEIYNPKEQENDEIKKLLLTNIIRTITIIGNDKDLGTPIKLPPTDSNKIILKLLNPFETRLRDLLKN